MKKEQVSRSMSAAGDLSGVLAVLEIPQKHRLKRYALWALPVVILVSFALRLGGNAEGAVRYKTDSVKRGGLTVRVTATGVLKPINQVDVGSELSGIVKSVEVDYNDRVKKGQVLAALDTTKIEAQIERSKAQLASARAKVLEARATLQESRNELKRLEEVRRLSDNKVPSERDMDAARAAVLRAEASEATATAAVAEASAALTLNETDLQKSTITSPIDGTVLERSVEPGQTVAASFQAPVLLTIAEDLTQMELHVDVDEADVGLIAEGQQATFGVDAYPNRTFSATISQVRYGSKTTNGVVTYETVLRVDNSDLSLRPGMTATADITVKHIEDALLVPNTALRFRPPTAEEPAPAAGSLFERLFPRPGRGQREQPAKVGRGKDAGVWILNGGTPERIPITAGATDGTFTEVLEGDLLDGMSLLIDTIVEAK